MTLYDDELMQSAQANYITGSRYGWRFKQAIPNLNLSKRSKPDFEPPPPALVSAEPKKRGRPKGGTKDPVKLAAREAARAAQEAARGARRDERKRLKAEKLAREQAKREAKAKQR